MYQVVIVKTKYILILFSYSCTLNTLYLNVLFLFISSVCCYGEKFSCEKNCKSYCWSFS